MTERDSIPVFHGSSVAGAVTVSVTVTVGPGTGDGRTVFVTVGAGCGRAVTVFRGSVTVFRGRGSAVTVIRTILSGPGTRTVTVTRGRGCSGFSDLGTLCGVDHTVSGSKVVTGLLTSDAPISAMATSASEPEAIYSFGCGRRAEPCAPIITLPLAR